MTAQKGLDLKGKNKSIPAFPGGRIVVGAGLFAKKSAARPLRVAAL